MRSSRRMRRMSRNQKVPVKMNLTSLMDVFTILVFFLLVNSASTEVLETPKQITLPASVVEDKPRETVVIFVSPEEVTVQGEAVVRVADILASTSQNIAPIASKLEEVGRSVIGLKTRAAVESKEVTVLADRTVPFSVIKKVMSTATSEGYGRISLAVLQKAPETPQTQLEPVDETNVHDKALSEQLEQARARLDEVERELRAYDLELERLSGERQQIQLLHEVCGGLEKLSELGADELFWKGVVSDGHANASLALVRGRVDEFNRRIAEIESGRQSLLEKSEREQLTADYIEDDIFEAEQAEYERSLEWVVEREIDDSTDQPTLMPWTRGGEDDRLCPLAGPERCRTDCDGL